MSNLPTVMNFDGMPLTIIDNNGTPWLTASDVALALGYRREDKISRIYSRHKDEFTSGMATVIEAPILGANGNLRTSKRIFSPRGCHLIAMFSRTHRAKAFRRWILDVLDGIGRPAPAGSGAVEWPGLSPLHREQIRKVLWSQVSRLPRHLHATAYSNAWNDLKARFGVSTYHDIPEARFADAVAFVQGMNLAGQYGWRLMDDPGPPQALAAPKPDGDRMKIEILETMAALLGITPEMIDRERQARRVA